MNSLIFYYKKEPIVPKLYSSKYIARKCIKLYIVFKTVLLFNFILYSNIFCSCRLLLPTFCYILILVAMDCLSLSKLSPHFCWCCSMLLFKLLLYVVVFTCVQRHGKVKVDRESCGCSDHKFGSVLWSFQSCCDRSGVVLRSQNGFRFGDLGLTALLHHSCHGP